MKKNKKPIKERSIKLDILKPTYTIYWWPEDKTKEAKKELQDLARKAVALSKKEEEAYNIVIKSLERVVEEKEHFLAHGLEDQMIEYDYDYEDPDDKQRMKSENQTRLGKVRRTKLFIETLEYIKPTPEKMEDYKWENAVW